MKDYVATPDAGGLPQGHQGRSPGSPATRPTGLTIGARHPAGRHPRPQGDQGVATRRSGRRPSRSARPRSATWPPSAATCSSGPAAGTTSPAAATGLAGAIKDGKSLVRDGGQPLPRHLHDRRRRPLRQPVEPGRAADRPRRQGDVAGPDGERTIPVEDLYQVPKSEEDRELTVAPGESHQARRPAGEGQERLLRGPPEAVARLAAGAGVGQPARWTATRCRRPRIVVYGVAPIPWRSKAAEEAIAGKTITTETAAAAGEAADRRAPSRCR